MNLGKKIRVTLLISVFGLFLSGSVFAKAGDDYQRRSYSDGYHRDYDGGHHDYEYSGGSGSCKAVGAPLDGGLLAVLAGAGITYFAARRKRKTE